MLKRNGFTLIELFVVIAIIGLLTTLAVVSIGSARQKTNDVRRVSDVRGIIGGLAAASQAGAALCNAAGTAPCSAGNLVNSCTLYRTTCNGVATDNVTATYVNLPAMKDPVFSAACGKVPFENCDYTFVAVDDVSKFTIGFVTQGTGVAGLLSGLSHSANQAGIIQ